MVRAVWAPSKKTIGQNGTVDDDGSARPIDAPDSAWGGGFAWLTLNERGAMKHHAHGMLIAVIDK